METWLNLSGITSIKSYIENYGNETPMVVFRKHLKALGPKRNKHKDREFKLQD